MSLPCRITVAICTWNRSSMLARTLHALAEVTVPSDLDWECIVVDNNSSDDTSAVAGSFADRLPLRVVLETAQGLSNARNRAIDEARGRYIVWTDDDVLVDRNWLTSYVEGFERWPRAVVFGGKVLPWFEISPPAWLVENMEFLGSCYAMRDLGDEERLLVGAETPFGANMAFRRDAFETVRFDPELGRKEHNLIGGEETQVIAHLVEGGAEVVWLPASKVDHLLPGDRMTLSYIREYQRGQVAGEPVDGERAAATVFGLERWRLRYYLGLEARWRLLRLTGRESLRWLKVMCQAARERQRLVNGRRERGR